MSIRPRAACALPLFLTTARRQAGGRTSTSYRVRCTMDKNNNMADKGLANEIKGTVKETVGKVRGDIADALDDSSEHLKGRAQQAEGNIQKNFGKAEQKVDDKLNKTDTAFTDDGAKKI